MLVFMSINEELGRHRGQSDRQSILCVVLSVRVRSMCCGNVLITKIVGIYFMIKLRDLLGEFQINGHC